MAKRHADRFRGYPRLPSRVWQADLVRLPMLTEEEDGTSAFRPWAAFVLSPATGELVIQGPSSRPEKDFALVRKALSDLARQERVRPGRLEVRDPELAEALGGWLAEAGVELEVREELRELAVIVRESLMETQGESPLPGFLSVPGVTPERVASFAEAAVRFHEAAPWKHLSPQDLIEIQDPPSEDLRYAAVVESGYGVTLLFFESLAAFAYFAFDIPEPEWGDESDFETEDSENEIEEEEEEPGWWVGFDPPDEVPLEDLDLWDNLGLPFVGDGIYPVAARMAGGTVERPDAETLAFLEGVLRALGESSEEEMDRGTWERTVTTPKGERRFVLALPGLLDDPEEERKEDASASPEDQARALAFEAQEASGRKQLALVREALELWPDCAVAWMVLADRKEDPEEALELWEQAVAAADRASDPAGALARSGLATSLFELGRFEESANRLAEVLRDNPADSLGVRGQLAGLLVDLRRFEDAEELLARYPDERSASWTYTRALLAFRREGDTPDTRSLRQVALKANPQVPQRLLSRKPLPEVEEFDEEGEAIAYARFSRELWRSTPGALDWLRRA